MRDGFIPDYLPSTVVVDAERRHRLTAAERAGTPVRRRRRWNLRSRIGGWIGGRRSSRAAQEPATTTRHRFRLHH